MVAQRLRPGQPDVYKRQYYNKDFGVVAQNCGSAAAKPMTLYFCPQSRYYKDTRALACADGLVQHLLNHLHPEDVYKRQIFDSGLVFVQMAV